MPRVPGRARSSGWSTGGAGIGAARAALGLAGDTSVSDPSGAELFDVRPEPLNVQIQRALAEEEKADG